MADADKPAETSMVPISREENRRRGVQESKEGKKRRSPFLRVLQRIDQGVLERIDPSERLGWEPRPGLPAGGRAECRDGKRPCEYVRCKFHLWMVLSENRDGRPHGGKRPPSTLLPAWLENPTPPCCALDVAEAIDPKDAPVKRVAEAMHMGRSRVHDILAAAIAKLQRNPDARHLLLHWMNA